MDLAEQIRLLEAAHGDPAKLALATVDLAYPELPESERVVLTETLGAAAIPHWCDENILTALLEIPSEESANRLTRLSRLSVVEPFPARGIDAINVHEANRIALRKRMAEDDQARFRTLSARMAEHLAGDLTATGRIEWIYHLIGSEMERAATELEKLDRSWSNSAHPEDRYALASALAELEDTRIVRGRARAWVLLVIAWTRVSRGEAARLEDMASCILDLARSAEDLRAEGDAHCLLGDARRAQGKLADAQAAFGEFLTISRRLAEQDPSNAGWQRELAVAKSRMGDILQALGKLDEAPAAFREDLTISRRLAEQDPSNAGGQYDLALAQRRVGDMLQAEGKLAEAQTAYEESLTIIRRLAEQDPKNAGWQRGLAAAQSRIGDVLRTQGKMAEAMAAFGEFLTISRRVAERDPSNAAWQRGLAVAQSRMGDMLQAEGKLAEAQTAYGESLTIIRRLAEQDPNNAGRQRGLAVTQSRVGDVLQAQGKLREALAAFVESLTISRRLAEQDPGSATWQRDLAVTYVKIARLESERGEHRAAIRWYEEASRILSTPPRSAAEFAPSITKENVDSELRSVRTKAHEA